jgi:hypothetical protein
MSPLPPFHRQVGPTRPTATTEQRGMGPYRVDSSGFNDTYREPLYSSNNYQRLQILERTTCAKLERGRQVKGQR